MAKTILEDIYEKLRERDRSMGSKEIQELVDNNHPLLIGIHRLERYTKDVIRPLVTSMEVLHLTEEEILKGFLNLTNRGDFDAPLVEYKPFVQDWSGMYTHLGDIVNVPLEKEIYIYSRKLDKEVRQIILEECRRAEEDLITTHIEMSKEINEGISMAQVRNILKDLEEDVANIIASFESRNPTPKIPGRDNDEN